MKKILCFMFLILSFAGSAFATTVANSATQNSIYGGADSTAAGAAATPLIRFSTNVTGQVNYTSDSTTKTSKGYVIATRHATGSKDFGTTNILTNIFWKQASRIVAMSFCEPRS